MSKKRRDKTRLGKERTSQRRTNKVYGARAGQAVSFAVGAPQTRKRYFVEAGTPILAMKHGVPIREHETKETQIFNSDHGPFIGVGGLWGFLIDGWVFLVHPSKVKVYGEV